MEKTKVTYMDVDSLIPYANNPRLNDNAVDAVAASIKEFGFKVPIVVDGESVIINGHTRLKAAHKLGLKQVPVIVADDLTPEQVKAFRLADNKTGELAQWDMAKLGIELDGIEDIDMTDFGFDFEELEEDEPQADDTYTKKVNIPQYEPTGECPSIDELVDDSKANELVMRIQDSTRHARGTRVPNQGSNPTLRLQLQERRGVLRQRDARDAGAYGGLGARHHRRRGRNRQGICEACRGHRLHER